MLSSASADIVKLIVLQTGDYININNTVSHLFPMYKQNEAKPVVTKPSGIILLKITSSFFFLTNSQQDIIIIPIDIINLDPDEQVAVIGQFHSSVQTNVRILNL